MGGHVIFSLFDYFDQLLDAAVGTGEENWAVHERVSYTIERKGTNFKRATCCNHCGLFS